MNCPICQKVANLFEDDIEVYYACNEGNVIENGNEKVLIPHWTRCFTKESRRIVQHYDFGDITVRTLRRYPSEKYPHVREYTAFDHETCERLERVSRVLSFDEIKSKVDRLQRALILK